MNEREFLRQFRQKPEAEKILRTIRFAEGTAGPKGYQTMFGGGTFSDFSRHPDRVVRTPGYASAAAGAFQFLPGTWQGRAKALGLSDFSPQNQDLAALSLVRSRLMPIGGLSTLEKEGLSPRVAARLAPEWASFPTETGRSYYGQPVKPLTQLQKVYASTAPGPAPAPAQPTAAKPSPREQGNKLGSDFVQSLLKQLIPGMIQPQSSLPNTDELLGGKLLPMPMNYMDDYISLLQ